MASNIRIKPRLQLLLHDGNFDFIKTLDEGTTLPDTPFTRSLLDLLAEETEETTLLNRLTERTNTPPHTARQFLEQLIGAGILERFSTEKNTEFERYERQMLFFDSLAPAPVFEQNLERQRRLAAAHIAIIGIGGIGNYLALSLAASGVGKITLVDADRVEPSNLSRQILFSADDIGQPKVLAAARRLRAANPDCRFLTFEKMIDTREKLAALLEEIHPVDYLVLSADQAPGLAGWASDLRKQFNFKAIKCGYMGHQGLIGPIIGPDTRRFDEIFPSWADLIENQPDLVARHQSRFAAPSSSASNAILANIACLEVLKDLTGAGQVNLRERRMLLNLNTLEMRWA